MLHKNVEVRSSLLGGKGLFAKENINKDESLWKLDVNEKILTEEEKDNSDSDIKKLAFQYKDGYIVTTDGSQFMNHSCEPNTWWSSDEELTALRDIKANEEITYDYSTADVGNWVADWECKCGSKDCRYRITGNDCLNESFQKKYKGHLPSWTIKYIKENSTR